METDDHLCVINLGGGGGVLHIMGYMGEALRMLERGYLFQAGGIELVVGILTAR